MLIFIPVSPHWDFYWLCHLMPAMMMHISVNLYLSWDHQTISHIQRCGRSFKSMSFSSTQRTKTCYYAILVSRHYSFTQFKFIFTFFPCDWQYIFCVRSIPWHTQVCLLLIDFNYFVMMSAVSLPWKQHWNPILFLQGLQQDRKRPSAL